MTDLPPRHEPPKKNGLTDYGPKTAAASDHPYDFDEIPPPPQRREHRQMRIPASTAKRIWAHQMPKGE